MNELNLGKKMQLFRTARSMSIRELADETGITSSMLSQIEHEQVNPSINTLKKIADALNVPLYRFFQGDPTQEPVVFSSSRKTIGRTDLGDGVFFELLTPDTIGDIEFCMMIIPPFSDSADSIHCHVGEEVAYIHEGENIELVIDEVSYILNQDDSVRIRPFNNHIWKNNGGNLAKVIFAITPPSF